MNFIEELYFGNINPNEKRFDRDSQYARSLEEFCKNENNLSDMLSAEQQQLFNQLVNAHDEITSCTTIEYFKIGFILGVQLMTDCFKYDAKTMFKDI